MSKEQLNVAAQEIMSIINDKYDGDIFFFTRTEKLFSFSSNNKPTKRKCQSEQLALRVTNEGNVGYSSAAGYYNAQQIVKDALFTIKYNSEGIKLSNEDQLLRNDSVSIYDPQILKLDFEFVNQVRHQLQKNVRDTHFACRLYIVEDDINYLRFLRTKEQYKKTYIKSVLKVEFEGTNNEGSKILHYRQGSCKNFDFVTDICKKIKERDHLPTVDYTILMNTPLLFSPMAIYCIAKNYLGFLLNEKLSIQRNASVKLGGKVNIYDDGTIDWKIGSRPFDDEGIETQRNCLIHDGCIIQKYNNMVLAQRNDSKITGNGSRGWGSPPSPEFNNLIIEFNSDIELKTCNKLLYIDYVEDDGTSDNINGFFHGNCTIGFLYKHTSIIGMTHTIHLDIDIKKLLAYALPHSGGEWVAGNFYCPSIMVDMYSLICAKER